MPVDRRSIGRTLTRHVLLVGVVAAALACLLLLTRIYLDEREAMQAHLREVESSQLPPLTAALWEVDPQRIDALLDGIAVRPGVSEVVLHSAEGEQWRSGVGAEPVWMQARFPLTHASQPDRPLGELEVHIGRSHGLARVMRQLPLLLLIVLGSMLGAAWVISRQFRQRVSEPLAELARYAEGLSGEALDRPLQWSRRRVGGSEDEIDQLVRAFNDMRERLHQGISRQAEQEAALRQQQQRLESEVAQRTQDLSERLVQLTQAKSATDAARAQAEQLASRLADFADISADGFWETDADLRLVMVTPHFADLIGADLPDLLGKTPAEAYRARFPEAPDLEPYMRPLRERHEIEGQPLLLVDRHGARHWVINNGKPVYDANGDFLGYRGAITDITDNRRAERALQASERRFRLITDNVPALISYVDRQRLFRYNNKVYQDWLRMPLEQITDRSVADVYGAEVYRAIEPHLEAALGGQRSTFEIELQGRIYRATYVPDVDGQGDVAGAYGLIHDITRLKRVERDLRHAALYDGLTGLANRRHFEAVLLEAIERSEREGRSMALMFIDLDHFKAINDQLGHEAGDQVLRHVGTQLQSNLRAADTPARLAGDEFVVILEHLNHSDEVGCVASKLLRAIAGPLPLSGEARHLSASMGIALRLAGETDPEALLRRADAALYQAKAAGRGCFRVARSESALATE